METSTYALIGSGGLLLLLLLLYGWQAKRSFAEWKRWDNSCRNSSSSCVRRLWCLFRPCFSCLAVVFRLLLSCIGSCWGGIYRRMDSTGTQRCPGLWDSVKRCFSHILGTCWYASSTAVVSIDNTISESTRLNRVKKGRSAKILRQMAEKFLEQHKAKGFAVSGCTVPPRAERGSVANPAEGARSYSSVLGGAAAGTGAAQSMLDSGEAWSAENNAAGEWVQLDLGCDMMVVGVVTQGKRGSTARGTHFNVQFRADGDRWHHIEGQLSAESYGEEQARSLFPSPVAARHLRIAVLQWREQVALRAGALVADDLWGAMAILESSTQYLDGWQAPFKPLRHAVCEELCRRVSECLKDAQNLEKETEEYRSRSDVNLGKESNDPAMYTREGVFAGAGVMESLAACACIAEDVGAGLTHPAFKPAGKLLENAVRQRIQWGLGKPGDQKHKALRYGFLCASALGQLGLAEVKEAAKQYKDFLGLPPDWDVLAMAKENAYGYRMVQKVKLSGCLMATAPLPGTFAAALQSLLDDTFVSKFTRDRKDGNAVPHRLVLVSATAVQNEQSWLEYTRRRAEIRQALQGQALDPSQQFGTAMPPPIVTRADGSKKLPPLDSDVQEAWLFHGTTAAGAEGITSEDFKINLAGSGAGTLYGRGIYLAEACTKSDEYTKEEQLGTDRYLLLCRATLGRIFYTDKARNDPNQLEDMCKSGLYHSVLGDREKARGTFREFMVYDDDQCYAAYIICYRRQIYNWKEAVAK